jgi:hypothetical protein
MAKKKVDPKEFDLENDVTPKATDLYKEVASIVRSVMEVEKSIAERVKGVSVHEGHAERHSAVARDITTPANGAVVPVPTVGANESERVAQIAASNLNFRNS